MPCDMLLSNLSSLNSGLLNSVGTILTHCQSIRPQAQVPGPLFHLTNGRSEPICSAVHISATDSRKKMHYNPNLTLWIMTVDAFQVNGFSSCPWPTKILQPFPTSVIAPSVSNSLDEMDTVHKQSKGQQEQYNTPWGVYSHQTWQRQRVAISPTWAIPPDPLYMFPSRVILNNIM